MPLPPTPASLSVGRGGRSFIPGRNCVKLQPREPGGVDQGEIHATPATDASSTLSSYLSRGASLSVRALRIERGAEETDGGKESGENPAGQMS